MAAAVEAWTWIFREKPSFETSLMMEINAAWSSSIKFRKGMFSESLKQVIYVFLILLILIVSSSTDPFYHPVEYKPTDKTVINRGTATAQKLLSPHIQVLQMLFSRFQVARYNKGALMLLIMRLILRSAIAHKKMRYCS